MSAAVTGCAVLAATAWPAYALLTNAGAPTVIVLGAVTAVAAIAYLGTLAIWFPADARDLRSLIRRVRAHRPDPRGVPPRRGPGGQVVVSARKAAGPSRVGAA